MLLWIVVACVTAIVLLVVLAPLFGASPNDGSRAAFDAAVYRDQLGEVESDRERGLIGKDEAEAARTEIARRLLAADARERGEQKKAWHAPSRAVIGGVALLLPAFALSLYFIYGSPSLHDQPLAARLEDPTANTDLRAMVAQVEARLRADPGQGEGWDVIAPVYLAWGRYTDAAEAFGNASRLLGESPKRLVGQGQALVLANDGIVTEEARAVLERAVALDPELLEPRALLATAKEQDGKFKEAAEDWRALLAKAPADAPWRSKVEQEIAADEAKVAGRAVETPGGVAQSTPEEGAETAPDGKGPSAAEVAAANNMSPEQRQAMIETMVNRLAAQLEANGDDLAGWLKLVKSYSVLQRKDDALKALDRAKAKFSGNAQALEQLDQLAAELGLKS